MSDPYRDADYGPMPEAWASEFARRFVIMNTKGEFVSTEQVVLAWLRAVYAKGCESEKRGGS